MPKPQQTCHCAAYKFPHRYESGMCSAPECVAADETCPMCSECEYSHTERDPYGTGDNWFSLTECTLNYCPWEGK